MNNFWTVVLIFIIFSLITQISLSLGITSSIIDVPEVIDTSGDLTLWEALRFLINFGLNNIATFLQILTFNTELPIFFNAVILLPFGMGGFYLAFIMVRGGAS